MSPLSSNNVIYLIWKCWCVVLMHLVLNGMAVSLYCAIPIWSWHFYFIKIALSQQDLPPLYTSILHCVHYFKVHRLGGSLYRSAAKTASSLCQLLNKVIPSSSIDKRLPLQNKLSCRAKRKQRKALFGAFEQGAAYTIVWWQLRNFIVW